MSSGTSDQPRLLPEQRAGAALRAAREAGGIGLREMARRLNYSSHSGLSEYEKGVKMPPEAVVAGYEHILGLEPGVLTAVLEAANVERHGDAWSKRKVHIPVQFVPVKPPSANVIAPEEPEVVAAPPRHRRRRLMWAAVGVVVVVVLIATVAAWPKRLSNGWWPPTCADVGDRNRGALDPLWSGVFRVAYERAGGRAELGCPRTDDPSGYVHPWEPGTSQDLEGGRAGKARIMALTPQRAIVMAGSYWHDYTDGYTSQAAPIMGYPTSDPVACGPARLVLLVGGVESPGAMVTTARTGRFVWLPPLIWQRYEALGGPRGRLGRPLSALTQVPSGVEQTFEHGYIKVIDGVAKSDVEDRSEQEPEPSVSMAGCVNLATGP